MASNTSVWEDEGGAATQTARYLVPLSEMPACELAGSEALVEWAQRIRRQVAAEFDRVEAAFRSVAKKQAEKRRADTEAVIAILEEKRVAVLNHGRAGYFIREWQEITDQVTQLIRHDSRYQALKAEQSKEAQF
jgi:hypothetical protein